MISGSCNISIDGMGNAHIWLLSDSKINFLPLSESVSLHVYILLASPWASERFKTNVKMFVVMSSVILDNCFVSVL